MKKCKHRWVVGQYSGGYGTHCAKCGAKDCRCILCGDTGRINDGLGDRTCPQCLGEGVQGSNHDTVERLRKDGIPFHSIHPNIGLRTPDDPQCPTCKKLKEELLEAKIRIMEVEKVACMYQRFAQEYKAELAKADAMILKWQCNSVREPRRKR